jgi:hypothetical protein
VTSSPDGAATAGAGAGAGAGVEVAGVEGTEAAAGAAAGATAGVVLLEVAGDALGFAWVNFYEVGRCGSAYFRNHNHQEIFLLNTQRLNYLIVAQDLAFQIL